MDIQEIIQERERDKHNELAATMRKCQANYDAQEHPSYWADDDSEQPKQYDCVKCKCDKECFTDECHDGIMWVCPDCGKEQYE